DGRNHSTQYAGLRKNNTAACAARRRRCPNRKGNRAPCEEVAPVLFDHIPAVCGLSFLPSAVCRLQFAVRSFTTTARDTRQVAKQ
ncbi:hypothetical protein, partial [Gemmatimonas sp.]|uniref:hypothetical protein n=1 Tax=Gemmatimonas sp. TaxID=1962908 RepID=UPI00391F40B5